MAFTVLQKMIWLLNTPHLKLCTGEIALESRLKARRRDTIGILYTLSAFHSQCVTNAGSLRTAARKSEAEFDFVAVSCTVKLKWLTDYHTVIISWGTSVFCAHRDPITQYCNHIMQLTRARCLGRTEFAEP
jgi:hypothetical protein